MQKLVPLGIITAIILGFAVLTIGTTGCRFNSDSKMPDMPAGGNPPDMALPELKERLFSDHASFQTLTADCKATIVCPLLRGRFQPDRPIDITLPRGRIAIAKKDAKRPAKVYLRLSRAGTKFVELIGNGSEYQVKLPGFKDSYGGNYGDPIGETTNRIHFMPDDLASVFHLGSLFFDRSLVMRAYPRRADIIAGSVENPVAYPATWSIDSIQVTEETPIQAWVHSSLLVDRNSQRASRLDLFRKNGTLRTRIWCLNPRMFRIGDSASTYVPTSLVIWYPPPLEKTLVRIWLSNVELNRGVPKEVFELDR